MSVKNKFGSKSNGKIKNDLIKWRSVIGFSKYEVSSTGLIRNVYTQKIRKPSINEEYFEVELSAGEIKERHRVHRLVAIVFLSNPKNLPIVDHIDNNRQNNNVLNLRWVTYAQNSQFYVDNFREKTKLGKSKPILQYTEDGKIVKKWK